MVRQPGDYIYQSPVFWGTQRQGAVLSHVSSREGIEDNPEWHIMHLNEPRRVFAGSLMPAYDYLSEADLEALAAYMLTLK